MATGALIVCSIGAVIIAIDNKKHGVKTSWQTRIVLAGMFIFCAIGALAEWGVL